MPVPIFLVFAPTGCCGCCGCCRRLVGTAADLESAWDLAAGHLAGHAGLGRADVVIYETRHPGLTLWAPCPPVPAGRRARPVPVVRPAPDNRDVPDGVWW